MPYKPSIGEEYPLDILSEFGLTEGGLMSRRHLLPFEIILIIPQDEVFVDWQGFYFFYCCPVNKNIKS